MTVGARGQVSWAKDERFEAGWKRRIRQMASHLEPATSVADYGAGMEWLREYLGPGVAYYPSDYRARTPATIVCNFNDWEFPDVVADAGFVSGALEYIACPEWFIEQLASHAERVVLSYCTLEAQPDLRQRRRNNWVNALTEQELIALCETNKLRLVTIDRTLGTDPIFVFERTIPLSDRGILLYNRSPSGDFHNLGDYIQSLAAAVLAGIDITDAPRINRERLSEYDGRPLRLVMNGWYAHSCDALPASGKLSVEVLSFHLRRMPCEATQMARIEQWLREVGPIGCRDLHTLNLLAERDVPGYFSKCVTPLAGWEFRSTEKRDDVFIVDPWLPARRKWSSIRDAALALLFKIPLVLHVARERRAGWSPKALFDAALFVKTYGRFLSKRLLRRAKWRTQGFYRSAFTTDASIFAHARALLSEYGRAAMVITGRLHCALPCYGMHTPVLFVRGDDGQGRYDGLTDELPTVVIDATGIPRPNDLGLVDGPVRAVGISEEERRRLLDLLEHHREMRAQSR